MDAAEQKKIDSRKLLSSIKVLVVDNDKMTLLIARRLLINCGVLDANIKTSESGEDALKLLSQDVFDVLLSDLHMPEMDGLQLIQAVQQKPELRNLIILMMSTTDDLDTVYKCLRAGADHFILKPLTEHYLKNIWQLVYLKRSRARRPSIAPQDPSTPDHVDNQKQQTANLTNQIEALRSSMNTLVENSIKILSKEVEACLKRDVPKEQILSEIMRQFSRMDIFQEGFKRMITKLDVDTSTRKWLQEMAISDPDTSPSTSSSNSPSTEPNNSSSSSTTPALQDKALAHQADHQPQVDWLDHSASSYQSDLQRKLKDWDFDVFAPKAESDLLPYMEAIFLEFDLLNRFKISHEVFRKFLLDVLNNYRKKNPYHNFRHAADVTQTSYMLLSAGGAAQFLEPIDIFTLLLASLVHDVGHPGLNNNFQIQTNSTLALRYNDRHVLENFHASLGYELITQHGLLDNMNKDEKKLFRTQLIQAILATDLALHVEVMGKWNAIVETFDLKNKDHRTLLIQILIKTADISNPAKEFGQARAWAVMIQEEGFIQGDIEKSKQMVISPFCDREKEDLPKMQIGFAEFMVQPLIGQLNKLLPSIATLVSRLVENKRRWQDFQTASSLTDISAKKN